MPQPVSLEGRKGAADVMAVLRVSGLLGTGKEADMDNIVQDRCIEPYTCALTLKS